jgi:hypothetical protein
MFVNVRFSLKFNVLQEGNLIFIARLTSLLTRQKETGGGMV